MRSRRARYEVMKAREHTGPDAARVWDVYDRETGRTRTYATRAFIGDWK